MVLRVMGNVPEQPCAGKRDLKKIKFLCKIFIAFCVGQFRLRETREYFSIYSSNLMRVMLTEF